MSSEDSPNVAELARRCAEEMARYRRDGHYDPHHCYELFRCALVHRGEEAWTAIYEQYHRLVYHWLGHTPGDPDILVNHVFDRFWRGDRSRSPAGGAGSGLGLAIARQLVQAQGGRISVESQLGQGTVFTIELPAGGI